MQSNAQGAVSLAGQVVGAGAGGFFANPPGFLSKMRFANAAQRGEKEGVENGLLEARRAFF